MITWVLTVCIYTAVPSCLYMEFESKEECVAKAEQIVDRWGTSEFEVIKCEPEERV